MLMKEKNQWSNLVKGKIHLLLRYSMWAPTLTRIPTRFVPYFTFVPSFIIYFPFLLLLLLKSFFSFRVSSLAKIERSNSTRIQSES
uniref:Uncharacterized protein n=1 Tax=Brassica oleracea TaxID=3712 RepID=A0A3P6FX30_BRAOL|nr:unnamed protein product [Brassica oleracea]